MHGTIACMSDPTSAADLQLDKRALRVLAHPLRSRLLTELRVNGPATATELAARLNTNTGATSYHLRELESVALVSDSGEGLGKRRVWQASTASHSWQNSGFADDPDARASLDWLRRNYLSDYAAQAERWLEAERLWPSEWADQLGFGDVMLEVSAERLAEFHAEFEALAAKYGAAAQTANQGEGARKILFVTGAIPLDLAPPESQ
jgi:predicted ArsR family transcriptional regulator